VRAAGARYEIRTVLRHAIKQILIDRRGRATVIPENIFPELVGNGLVALTLHQVEDRLRGDELCRRADDRQVSEFLAYTSHLIEHFIEPVLEPDCAELVREIGDHAARHLVFQHPRVERNGFADRFVPAPGHETEIIGDLIKKLGIETSRIALLSKFLIYPFGRRVGSGVRQG
jgi:hypothetical protein